MITYEMLVEAKKLAKEAPKKLVYIPPGTPFTPPRHGARAPDLADLPHMRRFKIVNDLSKGE